MTQNKDDPFAAIEAEAARQALSEAAAKALNAARGRLILGRDAASAFFATLVLRLTPEVDPACETIATDGTTLSYAPAFVTGLSPDELVGVLAHEVLHCALAHPPRRGGREPARWNVACDLAVNPVLVGAGFTLPASRLMPGEGNYSAFPTGQSADEYYTLLSDDRKPGPPGSTPTPPIDEGASSVDGEFPPGSSTDPGGCGAVSDPVSPGEASQQQADWQVAVAQAERAAAGRGDLPGGLGRTVDRVLRPPADWREVLRTFVSSHARNDYSWGRPNRRFLWRGLYLPGLHSEELGEVVLAVDTSGSVGERELGVFAAEVNALLQAYDCTVTVLYHDTAVRKEQAWRSGDGVLVLEPVGGGGTDHRGVFERLARHDPVPACVVCLTDLDTVFPVHPPAVPVLWAVVGGNRSEPPFGTRVNLDDN